MSVSKLDAVKARLQGHTEVLSLVLSFADPATISSCLRVNTCYYALAVQHIDILYRHVYIDRETVESVFAGIDWQEIEEGWSKSARASSYDVDQYSDYPDAASRVADSSEGDEDWVDLFEGFGGGESPTDRESSSHDLALWGHLVAGNSDNKLPSSPEPHTSDNDYGTGSYLESIEQDRSTYGARDPNPETTSLQDSEEEYLAGSHPEYESNDVYACTYDTQGRLSLVEAPNLNDTSSRASPSPSFKVSEEGADQEQETFGDGPSDRPGQIDSSLGSPLNEPKAAGSLANLVAPGLFSMDSTVRHRYKVYALSKCWVLTISDSDSYEKNGSHSSHHVLHNGRAHRLFLRVVTLRILPLPGDYGGVTTQCSQRSRCPFTRELSPRKVVLRNLGTDVGNVLWGALLEKLVVFLPFAEWPDITVDNDDIYGAWLGPSHTAIKVIFGPFITRQNDTPTRRTTRWQETGVSETLAYITLFLRSIREKCSSLSVYGLERVKACRDKRADYEMEMQDGGSHWWGEREHSKMCYGPRELRDLVEFDLRTSPLSSNHDTDRAPTPVQYFTIEQYMTSETDDELFDQEVHFTARRTKWIASEYWSSKEDWFRAPPESELGEGSEHESDTDDDSPVLTELDWDASWLAQREQFEREAGVSGNQRVKEEEER